MKKSTKYSVALLSTTFLGGAPVVGNTHSTETTDQKTTIKDSFLSKLPTDLLQAAQYRTTFRSSVRASGNGSSGSPDPTVEPPPEENPYVNVSGGPFSPGENPNVNVSGGPLSPDEGNTPPPDTTPIINQLNFVGLNSRHSVGSQINARVNIVTPGRFGRFDLWVAITVPNVPGFIFLTGTAQQPVFTADALPFLRSLDTTLMTDHSILEFKVPPGIGGDYTFYALLVEEGKNPLDNTREYDRSNLAIQMITLENE